MEESKLSLSPSKYRLLKLPEIDFKNRPRLKTPEKRKNFSLSPLTHKNSAKQPFDPLKLSLKLAETTDVSTIEDFGQPSNRYDSVENRKISMADFTIRRPSGKNSYINSMGGITTETSQIHYPESTARRQLLAKYLPDSPHRGVIYPSVGPNLDAEPVKYRNELKDKNNYFGTFKNMDRILSKDALTGSPANIFLKECHSMQLLPYSFRMHQESGSLKSIKIR